MFKRRENLREETDFCLALDSQRNKGEKMGDDARKNLYTLCDTWVRIISAKACSLFSNLPSVPQYISTRIYSKSRLSESLFIYHVVYLIPLYALPPF